MIRRVFLGVALVALVAGLAVPASAAGPGARVGAWIKVCGAPGDCRIESQIRSADTKTTTLRFAVLTQPNLPLYLSVRYDATKFAKVDTVALQIDENRSHTFSVDGCGSAPVCGDVALATERVLDELRRGKLLRTALINRGKIVFIAEFDLAGFASVFDISDHFTFEEWLKEGL